MSITLADATAGLGPEPADDTATFVRAAVALVTIAAAMGVLTKFIRIPYTVALVLAGLGLALWAPRAINVRLSESLVLLLFLPPLLFQGGLNLDLSELARNWRVVALMALPGVILSTLATAVAVRYLLPASLPSEHANWLTALAIGAILAPTDPISVMAVFRALGVPHRLRVIVEGESLFNDGTGAALFTIFRAGIVAAAAGSEARLPGATSVAATFLTLTGIGTLVGLAMGLAAFWILKHLNDHTLETALTVALAWGTYLAADALHGSGVIAVVVAALLIGNYGKTLAMAEATRITLTGFWDGLDFLINSAVFLLVGLELASPDVGGWNSLARASVFVGAAAVLASLLASRAAIVFGTAWLTRGSWEPGWRRIVWWAGLRGGLSLALSLGLPSPVREYVMPVVFVVVTVTLLLQGTTMQLLLRPGHGHK